MSDNTLDRDRLDVHGLLRVTDSPLQSHGRDELLRQAELGGPEQGGDRRLYLSVALLEDFLERARRSPVQRVQFNRVGIRVKLYRRRDGHQYEVWQIISDEAKPEMPPIVETLFGSGAL